MHRRRANIAAIDPSSRCPPAPLACRPWTPPRSSDAELAREGSARRRQPLPPRRALTDAVTGGAFVVAAVALAVLADADRSLQVGPAIVLVAMFALGFRVRIDVGVSYTAPVQLAFVPMLLLLPTPAVPLLVLLGWLVGRLPDLRGTDGIHPDRLLLIPADCWFALGPALVLIARRRPDARLGATGRSTWPRWPRSSRSSCSSATSATGSARASRPRLRGARAADSSGRSTRCCPRSACSPPSPRTTFTYAFVLVIPLAGLLVALRARARRSGSRTPSRCADAARDREALIAGASHELVTPLGVLVGLTSRLVYGGELSRERRDQLDTVMRREVIALRHVVRQFVDYTRLKTERDLQLRPEPTRLEPVAADIVIALTGSGRVGVTPTEALPPALVDPDRAHQMVMSVTAEALEGSRRGAARARARRAGRARRCSP